MSISAIKRKSIAAETTVRFFQTIDLIVSHLKRDADKQKIFEIIGKESKLSQLLLAAAAIHAYHNLGIRIKDPVDLGHVSVESTFKLEKMEKDTLYQEIESFVEDSFNREITLHIKMLKLRQRILTHLLNIKNLRERQIEQEETDIKQDMEKTIMELIQKYPSYHFFDFLGDLLGYSYQVKGQILEESSELKMISVEIEKELSMKEKEEKYIELSTFLRLGDIIKEKFEFRSFKELQMQTMSIRMILRRALEHNFDIFPISMRGLQLFLNANQTKLQIIQTIEEGLQQEKNYESFEQELINFIKEGLAERIKEPVNDFVYYLQNLLNYSFSDTIFLLKRYGVNNLTHLNRITGEMIQKITEAMKNFNITKFDLITLRDPQKNPIFLAKNGFNKLKKGFSEFQSPRLNTEEMKFVDLKEACILEEYKKDIEKVCEDIGITFNELKMYLLKAQIIDQKILNPNKLHDYSQLLLILNYEEILLNLARDVYFSIFSEILRQLGRILETYVKISDDKALFLLGLRKIFSTTGTEEWIVVKIEELMIERLLRRQDELSIVFNAANNAFLVNGFILARLTDKSLKEGIREFETEVSPIFEDIAPLTIKNENMSPVSYIIAYDLLQRFKTFEEIRKLKVEERSEQKKQKEEEKKKEIREKQEISTLNWIERKITSSLMRISSPGINPNQLYWSEKDNKTAAENLKLHSELKGHSIELFAQYFHFALEKIKERWENAKIPTYDKAKDMVLKIAVPIVQKRLNNEPSTEDFDSMIDGERWEIAKTISMRIGKFLDKALYEKFKTSRNK